MARQARRPLATSTGHPRGTSAWSRCGSSRSGSSLRALEARLQGGAPARPQSDEPAGAERACSRRWRSRRARRWCSCWSSSAGQAAPHAPQPLHAGAAFGPLPQALFARRGAAARSWTRHTGGPGGGAWRRGSLDQALALDVERPGRPPRGDRALRGVSRTTRGRCSASPRRRRVARGGGGRRSGPVAVGTGRGPCPEPAAASCATTTWRPAGRAAAPRSRDGGAPPAAGADGRGEAGDRQRNGSPRLQLSGCCCRCGEAGRV